MVPAGTISSQMRPSLGTVAIEPPAVLDRLAGDAIAGEARQPQIGGARDDALLAGRQREVGAALGDHVVAHQEDLAVAADRKALDGGDPELFDAVTLVRAVWLREPAIDSCSRSRGRVAGTR